MAKKKSPAKDVKAGLDTTPQPPLATSSVIRAAEMAHEANRGYCAALGDKSQLPWSEAPDWQRDSAINGVLHVMGNPDATPGDSHRSWLAEKERDGWKYGPVKDVEAKEHPCFVPFDELPPDQQAKDHIFLAVVRAALATDSYVNGIEPMDQPTESTETAFPTEGDNFAAADAPAHGTFAWACLQAAAGMVIGREGNPVGIHFANPQGRARMTGEDVEATDWQTITVW